MNIILKILSWKKIKKNVAKHEIPKWRPNARWTPRRLYRLKLVYLIFFEFFLGLFKFD
jgi:hypothetical protein